MDTSKIGESDESERLLRRAAGGDREALGALLQRHRARLRRMVALRLDRRLRGRIDPSDVLQEAQLEAAGRLADYLRDPAVPFFLWLRFLVGQRLAILHRRHLGAEARDADREVSIDRAAPPRASSAALAAQLLGRDTRPSEALARAERKARLAEALEGMDPLDREVLALRHFEQLSNAEAARVLGLRESAASKRYIRALTRLKAILSAMPGGPGELEP
jgi:RNA polymerase sigma-70 factor (ECF subfamily)